MNDKKYKGISGATVVVFIAVIFFVLWMTSRVQMRGQEITFTQFEQEIKDDNVTEVAMGADAALIARPFVTAAYGAGVQGVSAYTAKTGGELRDTMAMCGAFAVKEITEEMLW